MTSAVPPRRPRPHRRPAPTPSTTEAAQQARVDAFFAGGADDGTRRSSLMARVRTDAALRRRACVGTIGAGVALFVLATVTTPVAGADAAHHRTRVAAHPAATTHIALPAAAVITAAPTVRKTVAPKPTHVATPAPATAKTISGLAANGIPKVALNAYRVAAARLAHVEPGCGVDWALIAGIGREESDHGRYGGATLHADGISTPAIVGPALDGIHWDYIPVSAEYIRVTGDTTYAHALGPMQFIPTTWAAYGADADGDGTANIFDINDAALGTARYLCAAGGNLRTHAGQVAAVLAYNHSDQYLAQVLALADAYRRGIAISGIPLGNITGSLPKVTHVGSIPPANPGAPTAVKKSSGATKPATKTSSAPSKSAPAPSTGTSRTPGSGSGRTRSSSAGPSSSTSSGSSGGPSSSVPSDSPSTPTSSPTPSSTTSTTPCALPLPDTCI